MFQYADPDGFSFHWAKVGSRRPMKTTEEPNILNFPSVSERDFGHYQCEVREAGKTVLTMYRALYKNEGVAQSVIIIIVYILLFCKIVLCL